MKTENTTTSQYGRTNVEKTHNKLSGKGILKTANNSDIPNLEENEELITREEVKGTPFHILGDSEKGYSLTYGIFRISESKETKEEVLELTKEPNWDIIGNFIFAIMAGRDMMNEKIKSEGERMAERYNERIGGIKGGLENEG